MLVARALEMQVQSRSAIPGSAEDVEEHTNKLSIAKLTKAVAL